MLLKSKNKLQKDNKENATLFTLTIPKIKPNFSIIYSIKNTFALGWIQFKGIIKSIPFIGIVFGGILLLLSNAVNIGEFLDTNTYPVTYNLLEFTSGNFMLIILIIIVFYSGELVWQDRNIKINRRRGEYETVETVQYSAVPGDDMGRILYAEIAFNN